jgi:hypothetical protein
MSPRPWVPVALLGALLAACSGSVQKGSSDSGTSGDGPCHGCPASPSAVYLTSTIGPGPSVASTCQIAETTPALEIGSVRSGVITGTAGTTVTCSVVPSGSGFDVCLQGNPDLQARELRRKPARRRVPMTCPAFRLQNAILRVKYASLVRLEGRAIRRISNRFV